jgi:hypothetical protein
MFVTLKVFKLIRPSNDGRRHGRGTYLFSSVCKCKPVLYFSTYFIVHVEALKYSSDVNFLKIVDLTCIGFSKICLILRKKGFLFI